MTVLGRPSDCTPQITEEICVRLADGESLRSICRDDHMPDKATVLRWVTQGRAGFAEQYAYAREAAGYSHADELADLRYGVLDGTIDPTDAKVIADILKWAAERMAPKKHSPRHQLSGADEGAIPFEGMTDEQLDARISALVAGGSGVNITEDGT